MLRQTGLICIQAAVTECMLGAMKRRHIMHIMWTFTAHKRKLKHTNMLHRKRLPFLSDRKQTTAYRRHTTHYWYFVSAINLHAN